MPKYLILNIKSGTGQNAKWHIFTDVLTSFNAEYGFIFEG
jgi:hypothetical protein